MQPSASVYDDFAIFCMLTPTRTAKAFCMWNLLRVTYCKAICIRGLFLDVVVRCMPLLDGTYPKVTRCPDGMFCMYRIIIDSAVLTSTG